MIRNDKFIKKICAVISVGTLFILWEIAAHNGWGQMRLFPPPSRFLKDLANDDFNIGIGSQKTTIPLSILASIFRVFVGLLFGFLLALLIGFLISTSQWTKLFIMPIVRLLLPIAPIAWIPLALVLFGISNQSAIFIVFMGVFFMLTIATVDSLEKVPQRYIDHALTRGATQKQIWLHVKIPFILPNVFTILRLNFIAAWMAVLAAEMTGLRDGLGGVFMTGRNLFDNELIMLGMFLIAIIGFIFDLFLKTIQNRFFWWSYN